MPQMFPSYFLMLFLFFIIIFVFFMCSTYWHPNYFMKDDKDFLNQGSEKSSNFITKW